MGKPDPGTGASGAFPWNAADAGLLYVTIVFAAGFVLGVVRTLVLLPQVGETAAVLIELPVILAVSWITCGAVLRRLPPASSMTTRAIVGAVAFVLLMAAETFLRVVILGRPPAEQLAHYATTAGAAGLAGQVLFALFPLIHPAGRR